MRQSFKNCFPARHVFSSIQNRAQNILAVSRITRESKSLVDWSVGVPGTIISRSLKICVIGNLTKLSEKRISFRSSASQEAWIKQHQSSSQQRLISS